MNRKKWLIISIAATVLSAGIKIHSYVNRVSQKEEISCSYTVSGEKWTADTENERLFRHSKISGVSLVIDENHIGTSFSPQQAALRMKYSFTDKEMTCEIGENFERDGVQWVSLYAENGEGIRVLQYITALGDSVYTVTYVAAEESYEAGLSDFEEILYSFEFTE